MCDGPEVSDDELDSHARVSHIQMSDDELKKMIKELSEELSADTTNGRKRKVAALATGLHRLHPRGNFLNANIFSGN
jgi:hypothetical protein